MVFLTYIRLAGYLLPYWRIGLKREAVLEYKVVSCGVPSWWITANSLRRHREGVNWWDASPGETMPQPADHFIA